MRTSFVQNILESQERERERERWVAHMKKEALHTAAREADLPAISHITWQAENPDIRLGRTRQTSA
jgi:hypothetical protein